jgi:hypothetical protein
VETDPTVYDHDNPIKLKDIRWPGPLFNPHAKEDQTWREKPIPQPNEWFDAVPAHRLPKFLRLWQYMKPRFLLDPELNVLVAKLDEIATGEPFIGTEAWKQQGPDLSPSLEEVQYQTPVGASINSEPAVSRWRSEFSSKRAKRLLARTDNHVKIPRSRRMSQKEVGRPRAPPHNNPEQHEQLVDYWVDALTHRLAEESPNNNPHPRLLIGVFPVFKPSDLNRSDPRFCMNGKISNEVIREILAHYQDRGGANRLRESSSHLDLLIGWDLMKMFHQFALDLASRAQESYLLPLSVVLEARTKMGLSCDTQLWELFTTMEGVLCVVVQPIGLTFGNASSPKLADEMYSLPLSRLRELGLRVVLQVDDGRLLCRHGPSETYAHLLVSLGYHWYLRLRLHLRSKKSPYLWPQSEGEFSGAYFDLRTMTIFQIPATRERHWRELMEVTLRLKKGTLVTLREYTRVMSQQCSQAEMSYPIGYMVNPLRQHSALQQKELLKTAPPDKVWDLPVAKPDRLTMDAHDALLRPSRVGNYMRVSGTPLLKVTADTSTTGMGGEITNCTTATTTLVHQYLDKRQQSLWHTPQELEGVCFATLSALQSNPELRAPSNNPVPLPMGTDNTAAQKNINKPGSKVSMVAPMIPVALAARSRNMIPVGVRMSKHYMDLESKCDEIGRRVSSHHPEEWGLIPKLIKRATQLLGLPLRTHKDIDLFACRNTRQCTQYVPQHPDGWSTRSDAMSLNWDLIKGRLYAFPPEVLLHRVVEKIRTMYKQVLLVVPLYAHKHTYWPDLVAMMVAYVPIPFHPLNFVTPDGTPPHIDRHTRSTLILCLLRPELWNPEECPIPKQSRSPRTPTTQEVSLVAANNSPEAGFLLQPSVIQRSHLKVLNGI